MDHRTCSKLYAFAARDKTLLLDVGNHRLYALHGALVADVVDRLVDKAATATEPAPEAQQVVEAVVQDLENRYEREAVLEVLRQLGQVGVLLPPASKAIASVCAPVEPGGPIQTVEVCGLGEAHIGEGWLRRVLEYALQVSQPDQPLYVLFVGADSLRAWPAIQPVLDQAASIKEKRPITFIIDVAPRQLTPEIMDGLKKHEVALRVRVQGAQVSTRLDPALQALISQVDGRLAVHIESDQSVDVNAAAVNTLCRAGAKLIYLEGLAGAEQVQALYARISEGDNGHQPLFRLAELTSLMAACHLGGYRLYGCQAGWGAVAVAPNGDLYPCHRFVGLEQFRLGNIEDGISSDRQIPFCAHPVDGRPICQACWARYFCGGGCAYQNWQQQGDLHTPAEAFCALAQERLRCALQTYSELERERKNTLDVSLAVATHHKPYLAFTRSSPAPRPGGKA